ncbi:MAG: cysteine desulfurase [Cenarchaeum symbiont of Oopsacas minuta]|nr:cysteine desulfurase [Cenarchaeum symbiont of Oopsacas minuta]
MTKLEFACGDRTYLNNASVAPMPIASIMAISDFLTKYSKMGPDSAESEPFVTEILRQTRKAISDIIKCQPDEIILTQSTTDGINAVASGLPHKDGAITLIRGMEHEHHSNFYPWLRRTNGHLQSLTIDENGFFDMGDLRAIIKEGRTELVSLSHALYNTGAILAVEEVGEILNSEHIPFFVDAAQSVGCLEVDVKKIGCNFMSFNGSKWLCGPMGMGIFYCSRKASDTLEPLGIGGESATVYVDGYTKVAFKGMPEKFQTGFRNYAGAAGLVCSTKILSDYGFGNIRKRISFLANFLRDGLSSIPGVTLYGPREDHLRTSIVPFTTNVAPKDAVKKLESNGLVLAVREIGEKKIIRASPHIFNTESQMEDAIRVIKTL